MNQRHDRQGDERVTAMSGVTSLVVGLGSTGLSIARYLAGRGETFAVADSRREPPAAEAFGREFPDCELHLGPFSSTLFTRFERLLLSPGVPFDDPAVAAARAAGVDVCGDIELFAHEVTVPVVAITGSNGKSTVTELVGAMARQAGRRVAVGGNLGTPALALLAEGIELYVLELSSFQLEQTRSLQPAAAVVLNISDDHLDRHHTMAAYTAIKGTVYADAMLSVVNRDDTAVMALAPASQPQTSFGLDAPSGAGEYGVISRNGRDWLARGEELLLACDEMRLPGGHNRANALAAIALGQGVGLPMAAMCETLRHFSGLEHRCSWVRQYKGVDYYDDSKGTNVGATLAALQGMPGERVVLIAGGEGKGADFSPLRHEVARRARAVVLIGRDAALIAEALGDASPLLYAATMAEAVDAAVAVAEAGDAVLLSPACASFDMFANYQARGAAFVAAVEGLR